MKLKDLPFHQLGYIRHMTKIGGTAIMHQQKQTQKLKRLNA